MRKILLLILLIFVDFALLQNSKFELNKRSLLLVADVTGSMSDEIAQLRESCATILNNFYSRKHKPIANYVLSLFRDSLEPEDEFPDVINTTNPFDIQKVLNSTKVGGGGGDCPESPITGIERALPYALPNSLIYVFTDAGSNDKKKTERKVKTILREKQIKVTFFLSHGLCLSPESEESYYKLAEEMDGQVLKMEKKSVKDVLAAISDQLEDNYTPLETVKHQPGAHTENLEVSSELSKLIIIVQNNKSANSDNTILIGTDPKNVTHTSSVLGSNAAILVVPDPVSGKWVIHTKSDLPYEKSIAGLSKVSFDYGFSLQNTSQKTETSYQPIKNMQNYLNIFVSDPKEITKLDEVLLVFSDGVENWKLFKENDALYSTPAMSVPNKPFKMNLFGTDKNGLLIKRVLSTTIEPIERVYDFDNLLENWGLTNRVIRHFKELGITVETLKTISYAKLSEILETFPPATLVKVGRSIKLAFQNPNL